MCLKIDHAQPIVVKCILKSIQGLALFMFTLENCESFLFLQTTQICLFSAWLGKSRCWGGVFNTYVFLFELKIVNYWDKTGLRKSFIILRKIASNFVIEILNCVHIAYKCYMKCSIPPDFLTFVYLQFK